MSIVRFTTPDGHIDVTSNQLAAQTDYMTDIELIAYAVNYFSKVYTVKDIISVEIIAR